MYAQLIANLPTWMTTLPSPWSDILLWLLSPTVLGALAVGSIVMFVLSAAGLPWFVARIPADYFSTRELRAMGITRPRPKVWRQIVRVARNLLGWLLLLSGVAMLMLPGQGLLTIFVSLFLIDFPGKRGLQRRLVQNESVFRGLNALRRKMGAEPFVR
ncbi:MAG: hypothetical protein KC502_22045 [Myxococcales bacterium]|nr:hypothetical protein [Myxococcales bacterium]